MNWQLIAWVGGTALTVYGIKFVLMLIATLFSKDTMKGAINVMGESVANANKKVTKYLTKKVKQKKSIEKPEIMIR